MDRRRYQACLMAQGTGFTTLAKGCGDLRAHIQQQASVAGQALDSSNVIASARLWRGNLLISRKEYAS
jgi:hypothetical protein